jgi:Protein of unknown function (DUF3431)
MLPVQRPAGVRAGAVEAARTAFVGTFLGPSSRRGGGVRPSAKSRPRSRFGLLPWCLAFSLLLGVLSLLFSAWVEAALVRLSVQKPATAGTSSNDTLPVFQPGSNLSVHNSTCDAQLDPSVPLLFVGGQGGSGTRGVWDVLKASTVTVRSDRNTRDTLALREAGLSRGRRGATPFLAARGHNFSFATLHPALRSEFERSLCKFQRLLAPEVARFLASSTACALAMKEPRFMYMLPLLVESFPSLHFLHLTRDPRTVSKWHIEGHRSMHLRLFGKQGIETILAEAEAFFGKKRVASSPELRKRLLSIKMWSTTQRSLLQWCNEHLAPRGAYMHLRVEDLYVRHDEAALARLFDWMEFESSVEEREQLLNGGRGHEAKYVLTERNPRILDWTDHVGGDVLDALGYPRGSTLTDLAVPPPPPFLLSEAAQLEPAAAARMQSIFAGKVPRTELEVVLCRYDEDPSWAAPLAPFLTVYNTGKALPASALPSGAQVTALPNVGRESGSYLHHIVSRYDTLAELTVFSHAGLPASGLRSAVGGGHMVPGVFFLDYLLSPLFVFTTVLHLETKERIRLDSFGVASDYADQPEVHESPATCFDIRTQGRHLGSAGIFRSHVARRCRQEQTANCSLEGYWEQYLQQPVPPQGALWFAQGARFSVTAEQIRRRPRADYERLLASVNISRDPSAGYFLEVLWWYILTSPTGVACPQPPNMFGLAKKPVDPVNAGTDYTHQPDYSDDEAEAEAVD